MEQESIVLKKKKNDQDDVSLKPKVKEIDLKVKETLVDDLKIDEKLNQLVEELKVESNDKQPEAEYLDDEQDVNVLEKPQEKEDNKHHVEEIQVPKQPKDEQETKLIEKEQDSTEKQVKDQIKACPISALKQECNENETNETEIKNVIKESNTVVKKEKGQDKKKKKRVVVNKVVGVEREMPSMRSFR